MGAREWNDGARQEKGVHKIMNQIYRWLTTPAFPGRESMINFSRGYIASALGVLLGVILVESVSTIFTILVALAGYYAGHFYGEFLDLDETGEPSPGDLPS